MRDDAEIYTYAAKGRRRSLRSDVFSTNVIILVIYHFACHVCPRSIIKCFSLISAQPIKTDSRGEACGRPRLPVVN